MKAAVVYRSSKGKTRRYAEAIAAHLRSLGAEVSVASVGEADLNEVAACDVVLLGCWTNGYFVIRQHPDQPWIDFVRDLPRTERPRVGLFTTYLLATGGMFDRMEEQIGDRLPRASVRLRSKTGELTDSDRRSIEALVRP